VSGLPAYQFFFRMSEEAARPYVEHPAADAVMYALIFVNYLCVAFIVTFFQAGLVAIVHARLRGERMGLGDGLRVAASHAGKIFLWSLLSATVGVVLNAVSRSYAGGKIVAMFAGAAWTLVTFFIVPTLILEPGTIGQAIKRSTETFKRTWGETLAMNFSVGTFMTLIAALSLFLMLPLIATQDFTLILTGFGVQVLFLVLLTFLSSTLDAIMRVVLYVYATTGAVPAGANADVIAGAVRKRS